MDSIETGKSNRHEPQALTIRRTGQNKQQQNKYHDFPLELMGGGGGGGERERERERQRETERDRERLRVTETETERQRQTETDRQRHRETEREQKHTKHRQQQQLIMTCQSKVYYLLNVYYFWHTQEQRTVSLNPKTHVSPGLQILYPFKVNC